MADSSASPARPPTATGGKASTGTNVLNQKFGPFPLWVYLAAVGIALYAYEKRKKSTTTSTSQTGASQSTAAGPVDPATGVPYSQEAGGAGAAGTSAFESLLAANAQSPQTNPQWEANAEAVLVGYGYPAVQVQSALNTYLAGGVLSSVQQEIVNAVIEAVGPPPSPPVTQTPSTNSPTTPPPSAPSPTPPLQVAPAPSSGGQSYVNVLATAQGAPGSQPNATGAASFTTPDPSGIGGAIEIPYGTYQTNGPVENGLQPIIGPGGEPFYVPVQNVHQV